MGMRFRKSIKLGKGVKINLNSKSVGMTIGTRGAHYTVNSKGRRTTTVGIPDTGLSYTHTSTASNRRQPRADQQEISATPAEKAERRKPTAQELNKRNYSPNTYRYSGIAMYVFAVIFALFSVAGVPLLGVPMCIVSLLVGRTFRKMYTELISTPADVDELKPGE